MSKDTQETPSKTPLDFLTSVKNSIINFSDSEEIRNMRDNASNLAETISDTANNLVENAAEQTESNQRSNQSYFAKL